MLSLFILWLNYSTFGFQEILSPLFFQQGTISFAVTYLLHHENIPSSSNLVIFSCSSSVINYFSRKSQFLLLQNGVQRTRSGQQMCSLLLKCTASRMSLQTEQGNICTYIHKPVFCFYLYIFKNHEFILIPMILIQNHMVHFRLLP